METDNVEVFTEKATTLYKEWIDRLLILTSLSCHIILVIVSSQRKHNPKLWVKVLVWVAYMLGAWVATIVLGNLAGNQRNPKNGCLEPEDMLQAFWAPFLLMHLGGADTTTAYSLQDYELFYRNALSFVFRVGVAIYIFIWSWSYNVLTFLAVPMFIVGIIKYGERWLALWLSKTKVHLPVNRPQTNDGSQSDIVRRGYFLFEKLTLLYDNQILSCKEREESYKIIHEVESAEDAFTIISVELGLMFDVLYTKSTVFRSKWGIILRCLNFICFVSVLVVFLTHRDIDAYPPADIHGTILLLVGAISLEVFTLIMVLFSEWTILLYRSFVERLHRCYIFKCIHGRKRWSKSMGQFNLLGFCFIHRHIINKDAEDTSPSWVDKLKNFFDKFLRKYISVTWVPVSNDLKILIFDQLKEKGEKMHDNYNDELCKKLLAQRGDSVLIKEELITFPPDHDHGSRWWTTEVAFNHSLLIWHIATTLCYYSDGGDTTEDANFSDPEISKRCSKQLSRYICDCFVGDGTKEDDNLSDIEKSKRTSSMLLSCYMLYLRVSNPCMLPDGIDEASYIETSNEVKNFFEEDNLKSIKDIKEACKKLLEAKPEKSGQQSVLHEGCELAGRLQALEDGSRKWKIISELWTEMLTYAANRCVWREHCVQLSAGGELLTHVRLLMVHLGLSEQYTIGGGHDNQRTP